MQNAPWGVFYIFRGRSFTHREIGILLSPFDFPPSSQRPRGGAGKKEGEVSAPPFPVTRRSRRGRPFYTPFYNGVTCGEVAHLVVTTPFIPAGRLT